MSRFRSSAIADVDFLQTVASLAGLPLNHSRAVHVAPAVVSDLRADLITCVACAGSAVDLCNVSTHLMPAELTQETASSCKTVALDKGNVQAQRALRRQNDQFKSADSAACQSRALEKDSKRGVATSASMRAA